MFGRQVHRFQDVTAEARLAVPADPPYDELMHRLRRLRRIPRSTIALVAAAVAMLVVSHFVPGSKPKFVHVGNRHRLPVDQTGWNDYLRTTLWIGAVLLLCYGGFRWNAATEPLTSEADARPRAFGGSVVDARTQVDPAVGMRPVNISKDR
jgi:hypothetical protein